ncbi:hypothetical protein Tco_0355010 [Tanacetum coccineum]
MSTLTFADTHNMVAFLEKPAKSDGFHEIIDFLNANQIDYALTVNPTIYTSCIEQFWATAKAKNTVNGERQLQALVDKKRVIIMESRLEKKQTRRKQRKETRVPQDETHHDDSVPIPSNDPLRSEKANDAQAKEIASLKKRVQKLERKKKSRTIRLKRLRKVGESSRVEFFKDKEGLDDHHGNEVIVDMAVGEKQEKVTTADEGVTAAKIDEITPTSAPTIVINELTLAQTLIEIKAAKPKAVTTAATTTTTRPKARGVVVQEPSEFKTTTSSPQASQPSKTKDKGKATMIEPEVPFKRKDQGTLDEELARNLELSCKLNL